MSTPWAEKMTNNPVCEANTTHKAIFSLFAGNQSEKDLLSTDLLQPVTYIRENYANEGKGKYIFPAIPLNFGHEKA